MRLRQGDYAQETVFGTDPVAVARQWVEQGAEALHLVDLDGAKEGRPINGSTIRRIVAEVAVPCQLGGGLRTAADIAEVLGWGVARVVLGTRACREPAWLEAMAHQHPGRVVLAIDARDGRVALDGWQTTTELSAVGLARRCGDWPLAALVYTDISRDGMMNGPNFPAYAVLRESVTRPLIASGGISTLDDVCRLADLGLAGCIIGRALYEGTIALPEALRAVTRRQPSPGT